MKNLKQEELFNIIGGCNIHPLIVAKVIYVWRYLKMSKLVNKVFE